MTKPKVNLELLEVDLNSGHWTGNAIEYILGAINAHERYKELMRNVSAILRDSAGRLGRCSPEHGVLHSLADDLYNATVAESEAP